MKLMTEFIEREHLQIINEVSEETGAKICRLRGPFLEAEKKNRNGRIYPISIIEREVRKFNEEKISKGRAVGEADHPACCLSKDFDVLTENGWKSFESLSLGEEILTLNNDGNIEKNTIENIIDEPYKGYAYRLKGMGIDSAFTPTHRFLLKDRYGKMEYATIDDIFKNRTKFSKYHIVKTGNWIGNDVDNIKIDGLTNEEYYSKCYWNFNNDVREDLIIDALTFVRFLGIWLSEGCITKEKYGIMISQNIGEKCDRIENMLNDFPLKWNKNIRNGKVIFSLNDIRLHKYLKVLGDCYNKFIPLEIKQLNSLYLNELVQWFIIGDGRTQYRNDKIVRQNLFSVSKKLIEDLHECLIKAGMSGNWTVIEPCDDYEFAGHMILAENKSDLFQLNISKTKGIYLDPRFLKIEIIEHDANVYCLTVKNSNFYMKQNNKSFWTGNSPQINIDRISHVIESLVMEDNVGRGVARLIDTPMGRIAKTLVSEGIILGMSTRGVGSLNGDRVGEEFQLLTVDLVLEPSCQQAFVEGVLENKEYIMDGDQIVEVAIRNLQKKVEKKYDPKSMSSNVLGYMNEFLRDIGRKKM